MPARFVLLGLLLSLLLPTLGCSSRSSSRKRYEALQQRERSKVDDFESAFNFLTEMHVFEPEQAATQASYHLNKWLDKAPPKDWERDPLLDRIPRDFAELVDEEALARNSFTFGDIYYIEFANLLADLADWAAEQDDPRMMDWFEENPDQLSEGELEQLILTHRLFDWVIRNVQLDPTPKPPESSEAGAGSSGDADKRPSERLVVGPGYTYLPNQTLLFGHGDKWLRARVFIALARQRGIPVVVLASDPTLGAQRPWLTGALIGKQIYLFDTELGLPIPNADGRGVATLDDARQDPQVLAQLKAGDDGYPFTAKDLERVTALIDASPEAVSKRMHQLEKSLTGGRRMILTADPSQLAQALRQSSGVTNVGLWVVPFDAVFFQQELDRRIVEQDPSVVIFMTERFMLSSGSPIVRGRRLHLRGEFQAEDETEMSAKKAYMSFRVDEKTLRKLATDEKTQREAGLKRTVADTDAQWANKLYIRELELRKGKMNASFWIGLVHYASGDYEAAREWFQRRTIDAPQKSDWVPGASYNLARAYEALGDYEEARKILLLDDSPQSLGNRIRARLLREWRDRKAKPATDKADSDKTDGDKANSANADSEPQD